MGDGALLGMDAHARPVVRRNRDLRRVSRDVPACREQVLQRLRAGAELVVCGARLPPGFRVCRDAFQLRPVPAVDLRPARRRQRLQPVPAVRSVPVDLHAAARRPVAARGRRPEPSAEAALAALGKLLRRLLRARRLPPQPRHRHPQRHLRVPVERPGSEAVLHRGPAPLALHGEPVRLDGRPHRLGRRQRHRRDEGERVQLRQPPASGRGQFPDLPQRSAGHRFRTLPGDRRRLLERAQHQLQQAHHRSQRPPDLRFPANSSPPGAARASTSTTAARNFPTDGGSPAPWRTCWRITGPAKSWATDSARTR